MKALLVSSLVGWTTLSAAAAPIKIVAAENFYGGVAAQIAGSDADVTSILSNPNQDPHEFTTNASTAKAVADADIVIYNGLGYDSWMDKLLGTPGKPGRVVICVADLIGAKNGDNPHIWYRLQTMPAVADKLAMEMFNVWKKNGGHKNALQVLHRAEEFKNSTAPLVETVLKEIPNKYRGTQVTATEPVFGYMADALGFKMLNYDFQINVMNDTEPGAAQTAAFEKSLTSRSVKVLFYNSQVSDPTTERLKKLAQKCGIPIVGVTETQPIDQKTYADWMMHEIELTRNALETTSPEK